MCFVRVRDCRKRSTQARRRGTARTGRVRYWSTGGALSRRDAAAAEPGWSAAAVATASSSAGGEASTRRRGTAAGVSSPAAGELCAAAVITHTRWQRGRDGRREQGTWRPPESGPDTQVLAPVRAPCSAHVLACMAWHARSWRGAHGVHVSTLAGPLPARYCDPVNRAHTSCYDPGA